MQKKRKERIRRGREVCMHVYMGTYLHGYVSVSECLYVFDTLCIRNDSVYLVMIFA